MIITNRTGLPAVFVQVMEDMERKEHKPVGESISVTRLIDSPKVVQLRYRHYDEITEDVVDRVWAMLGTAVHNVLERANKVLGNNAEEMLSIPHKFGGLITGTIDTYEEKEKAIIDYKVTSAYTVLYRSKESDWEKQVNCYALLYMNAGFDVQSVSIVAIMRDHSKVKAKSGNYPQEGIVRVPLRLWKKEDIENYARERVALHILASEQDDDDIPECTPEERWADETKYKIFKGENKTASKVCDSMEEAKAVMQELELKYPKHGFRIVESEGGDRRCLEYCSVNRFCHYFREKYENIIQTEGGVVCE